MNIRRSGFASFFDPSGRNLYPERGGTLYEWDLQKKKHGKRGSRVVAQRSAQQLK